MITNKYRIKKRCHHGVQNHASIFTVESHELIHTGQYHAVFKNGITDLFIIASKRGHAQEAEQSDQRGQKKQCRLWDSIVCILEGLFMCHINKRCHLVEAST